MAPLPVSVYITAGVISIIFALFLIYLSGLTTQPKAQTRLSQRKKKPPLTFSSEEELGKVIFQEIGKVLDSEEEGKRLSKRLSQILNQEVEKRVSMSTEQLTKKYELIIKEKERNEEIVLQKYRKISAEKKNTEAVIRSIAEGLVVIDKHGRIIMMNPAAEKLLEASSKEKVGKPLLENLSETQLVSLVKGTPEDKEKEIELVSASDDTKKVVRASTAIIENENGQTVGMVSVLTDITKQKELDRMKSNFIASVSHELRTPLVAIEKAISLLLNKSAGPLNETQQQFLSIADRNLKRLSTLINDLLDLSKLEAGKMRMQFELSYIDKVIDESIEAFRAWANTKSIKIEKNVASGLPQVEIDLQRIGQVLNNLIGNAIKFTPSGGTVTVEANLTKDKKEIEVSIKDTGVGIAKEDLLRIFDRFYQGSERSPTDITGTGLGLSIAKEIVNLHGGRIWAESEKGEGAKFTFTIPLKQQRHGG